MLDIDYIEGLTLDVKASIATSEDLDCSLIIANNAFPTLRIEDSHFIWPKEIAAFNDSQFSLIKCTSRGRTINLYNVEFSHLSLIPKYIVSGEPPKNIKGVDISLSGLYSFFDGYSNFEIKETFIKKMITDCFIKTPFNIGNDTYNFEVYHTYSYSKNIDTTTFIEDAIVRISKDNGDISLKEIENIVKRIRVLFSLLLGHDLSIRKTWLVNEEEMRCCPFYFFSPSKLSQPFKYAHECFIHPVQLITNDDWCNALNKSFNDDAGGSILEFWVRLVNMFSFKGFWEYEILGVVSLIEVYSKKHHEEHTHNPMPQRQFDNLKKSIKNYIRELKQSTVIYEKHSDVIDNFIEQIGYVKNSNTQDFRLLLNLLIGTLSDDIRNLIGFKDEDFSMIIKIRNSAAHGSPVDENIMKNIQRAMIVKEKLKFLLLYLFLNEINITDKRFIKMCGRTHNKIRLGAQLDEYTLDVINGVGVVLNVSSDIISKVKNFRDPEISIIYHVKSKICEIDNDKLKEIIKSMYTTYKEEYKNIVDLIYHKYSCGSIFSVEYCSSLYLCNNNEKAALHSAYLIRIND